ncbi:MAG: hypothetical protein ACP5D6_10185 [Kosmotogaceae bacterium]
MRFDKKNTAPKMAKFKLKIIRFKRLLPWGVAEVVFFIELIPD